MNNLSNIEREQQRQYELNKSAALLGHILSSISTMLIILFFLSIASNDAIYTMFLITSCVFWMFFQLLPAIEVMVVGDFKYDKPLKNFVHAFFLFVFVAKKVILHLRWITTGKDHPVLKNKTYW